MTEAPPLPNRSSDPVNRGLSTGVSGQALSQEPNEVEGLRRDLASRDRHHRQLQVEVGILTRDRKSDQEKLRAMGREVGRLSASLAAVEAELAIARGNFISIRRSLSWRITYPLRVLGRLLCWPFHAAVTHKNGRPRKRVFRLAFDDDGRVRAPYRVIFMKRSGLPRSRFRRWVEAGRLAMVRSGDVAAGEPTATQAKLSRGVEQTLARLRTAAASHRTHAGS